MKKTVKYLNKKAVKKVNAVLRARKRVPSKKDVLFSITARWPDGTQADIKLVNGDPPYIDPVLFDEHGEEIALGEPEAKTIEGTYRWDADEDIYELKIIPR